MASRFEIVDEEYIEELKDNEMKTRKIARSDERTLSKSGRTKFVSKFRRVRERCPRPTTVLGIQKFSNFALYVINK